MEEEGDIEETQLEQEPMFKFLSDSTQCEGAKAPNPKYEDGKVLPKKLRTRFLQEAKPCVPLEEIDPYFRNKQTFVVIGRWGTIHRFSSNPDGYFTLGPSNGIRRLAIYLLTNWIFSTFLVAVLLLNAEALMKAQNFEIMRSLDHTWKKSWVVDAMYVLNYICLAVYCFELVLKLIARGFIGDAFTCFRDPWTWLDVVVIWTGFYPYTSFILTAKSALWLRLFKIIPLIPSIRQACKLSGKALYQLRGMMILGIVLLWFFALLGMELYMGRFTQKCVKEFPQGAKVSDAMWEQHNRNMSNWLIGNQDNNYLTCGNLSGSTACPDGYVCLQGVGPNPDFGQTSFDNIWWSVLSVTRIATEDYTEAIFTLVVQAAGTWHRILFPAIFFLVTFPMGCLFFAILANFFAQSKTKKELEMEEITALADVHDFDAGHNPESLIVKEKNVDAPEELLGFRKSLHSFVYHDAIRNLLIGIIILDTITICSYHYGILENPIQSRIILVIIPYFVFLIYTVEFLLKIVALGPAKYFKIRWNYIDFIVLLTFFLEIPSYFGEFSGYMLAPIRLLKLIQYWPALRMIFKIYQQTLKMLTGWILYGIIVFAFIILIGPFELGTYWMDDVHGMRKVTAAADIPRWSFVDFWHSFRIVFRMQLGEWVETFWECYQKAGMLCVPYYLLANLCGAVFLSFLLIGVVYSSIKELQGNYDPSKDRGLKLLLRKACGFICSPIKRIQPKELIMKSQKNGSDTQNSENGADEQAKAKPEGKEGRRKKSIVAESTGQLRKVMQDCTEHILYKIVVCGIIIIASVAMIFENNHAGEDLQTALFVTEILFTILFFVIAIYELLSYGFKESLTNRGWLFDALIVLEMVLNLTIYKFSVTGAFRTGVFCIRSFRPLMLIHRIGWLKAAFRAIKLEVKMIWETVLAIFFIWLFFATFGVNWLAGLYHYCINPVDGTELPKWKSQCLASNNSWVNSEFNFDSTSSGFFNMFILSSRMGWVNVIGDATDAVGIDLPRQRETSKMWLIYYIAFLFIGAFGALGILFSYIYNKFQEDKGCDMLLTEDQAAKYTEAKTTKEPKQAWISLEGDYVPPPLSPCLLSFYNMVTNVKFDSLVMVIIILDNVILSLDQYQIYPNLDMVITCMRLAILLLYTIEMIVKLVSWGRHYFRSVWNWIDLFVVVSGIAEALAMEFANNVYSTSVFRMLRLFRIFRFLLAKECGSTTTKMLFSSLINIRHAFANLFLLQLVVIWAFAILGNYYFENVGKYAGLNNVVNFKSFSSSLWTLILLLGFPGITDISSALGQEEDCIRREDYKESDEYPQCGNRAAATGFLGLYASITFMVLLNMYAVLISEIIFELERYRSSTSKISNEVDEEMALQAFSNGDGGGELTEDPAENSEEGE